MLFISKCLAVSYISIGALSGFKKAALFTRTNNIYLLSTTVLETIVEHNMINMTSPLIISYPMTYLVYTCSNILFMAIGYGFGRTIGNIIKDLS